MSVLVFIQFILMWIYFASEKITCEIEVLNKRLRWLQSRNNCNLATPFFKKSPTGVLEVKVNVDVSNDSWVGYFKATTGFEYIACIPSTNLEEERTFPLMTVGLCYKACGWKKIFGMRNTTCYCDAKENYDESMTYSSPDNCVSIYKVNKQVVKENKQGIHNGMCIMFNSSRSYRWASCKQLNKIFCHKDNSPQSTGGHSWENSSKQCFNKSSHALTYNELQAINKSFNSFVWTSITCSDVIFKDKDYDSSLPNIRFGYLSKKKDGKIVLKFEHSSSDSVHEALCIKDSKIAPTTISTTRKRISTVSEGKISETSTSIDTGKPSPSETVTYSSFTFVQITTNLAQNQMNQKQSANNKDSGIFVIIGASIGSAAVIIAAVVAVVISKKRRSTTPKISEDAHDVVFSHAKSSDMTKDETHGDKKPDHYDVSCYSQTYCVGMEKVTESFKEDDTYDTTRADKIGGKNGSENIYNRLGADETYDSNSIENIADNIESSNTYGKLSGDTDTTYNIVGIEKETEFNGENIYNKTRKDINETYDSICKK